MRAFLMAGLLALVPTATAAADYLDTSNPNQTLTCTVVSEAEPIANDLCDQAEATIPVWVGARCFLATFFYLPTTWISPLAGYECWSVTHRTVTRACDGIVSPFMRLAEEAACR